MHRLLAAIALVAFATPSSAQAADHRRTTIGTLVDLNGNPMVDARVHGAYVPVGGEHRAPADAVHAVTDARGRFKIKLLPCAKYRIWAIGPSGEDGTRQVTGISWATAAEVLELTAIHRYVPRTVKFSGLAKWADDGPHRVRWLIDGAEAPFEPTEIDADGSMTLPPMAAVRCSGEVMNARDEVFETFTYDTKKARDSVRIDPPQEIPMRAVDSANEPVAGVEIWERLTSSWSDGDMLGQRSGGRHLWRSLGVTDAEGRLVARIAARNNPMTNTGWHQATFLGKKAGYAASFSGIRREPFKNGQEFDRADLKELPFAMLPEQPLEGRITGTGMRMRLVCEAKIRNKDGNGWINEKMLWSVEPDAEGRFQIAEMPTDFEKCELLAQPDPTIASGFPESLRRRVAPQPVGFHSRPIDRKKGLTIDLAGTHVVQLQVLDEQSGPAKGTRVMFLSRQEENVNCQWTTPQAVPDRAGRVAMRLETGKWLVFVRNATAMAHEVLDLGKDTELSLKLEPMPAMRGTVVDGKGNPIANAELDCHSSTHHSGNVKSDLEPIANSLNWRWIDSVRTDGDGKFVCAFLDMPNMYYEARFRIGGKQSSDFRIVASEEPETVVIK